ncbi:LLM class flavin-dependent oxidoreductase [Herbiconiux ginsengi]|uniref:Flavin-dependent oxidoreductase, luciferase family (Includes alkanesulfonate monooxygenase SsuD and methylene tetrahydromethanopterin reductase) n=1 Tax=Herbiconiux ginsengi TaxID=381665 RepID=A0A1H3MV11_9MICO|nr:LLM class flavin-dependent oxidoreductase [Herbiconiux ginsengi]SDY80045.1 Flavin-dependent oxidoreductase, luciferase family (includes alkanesulfonate monooxygenase SsuD and methylene tetrahydromethanopterin reductase) [Herbiconiux ginsengi]
MPHPGEPLQRLGFLTIGLFDPADPATGHETTLRIIELGEQLGFDSAWLRHRHLQYGISSPVAVLAAATQRTSRIELGTAVTPIGAENPFRLAEDLATVDLLSHGRITPGFSAGLPMNIDHYKDAIYPNTFEQEDFDYGRLLRFRDFVRGDVASSFAGTQGIEVFADTVQPHAAGLSKRLWYGGGSTRSAEWAGENGFHFLTSSVVQGENGDDFATNQLHQVRAYRAAHPDGAKARVSQGLVVIPTDSATAEQKAKYAAYAAGRSARVGVPHGPRRMLFAADIVGTSAEIAEALYADPAFREIREVAFALPFSFEHDDYVQILHDLAERLGPALGWHPGR